jgi:adenine deaminase
MSFFSQTLVSVAMGRAAADLVLRDGQWVCVQSGEILPHTDIAIKDGRIAYVGPDASHAIGAETRVIEAANRYLVPGLLDGHMHVESGMLTVTEFVRAVIPHGTTGMFIDPHEIANIFGLKGVKLMVDEAALQPIHVWVQMPSCVPSAPGLETSGASIGPAEVAEAMGWEGIIGLGEMMNFPGVFLGDEKMHAEMEATRRRGKVIGGHYASPDLGLPFHGYVAGGPQDDHEGTRLEDALARVRQGMKPMLRHGSGWRDVAAQARAITELGLDSRHFILCTDDSHCETLVHEGHVNRAVRVAIDSGIPPLTALQMATLNTAEHFGLEREIGMIAPGRYADILLVSDLQDFRAEVVIAQGQVAAENGHLLLDLPSFPYPEWVTNSIHLARLLTAEDFRLLSPRFGGEEEATRPHSGVKVMANIIGVIENQAPTRPLQMEVEVVDREVRLPRPPSLSAQGRGGRSRDVVEGGADLAKVAVVERHAARGDVQVGLVHGFGFNVPCAIGSTVAHDSHHMIVVGTDEANMALAGNELARMGGGQVVVRQGEVIGAVNLPIAGLMSSERAEVVAQKAATVLEGFRACGCQLNNPNMQLSLIALVVIPELRISDLGLVDVKQFRFIPVLEGR